MALRAAERSKLPPTRDGLAKSSSAVRATAVAARAIPLRLAPLLQPYRKQGRLSLRVERMQQLSRLSRGRNNGDGSWSLASDELDDLEYLSPEGMDDVQSLSIRIIGLDQDGTTLAIVEFAISPSGKQEGAAQRGAAATAAVAPDEDALIQIQRDELESLKSVLAEREAELASIRRPTEAADTELSREKLASELAAARESWKRELEQLLAEASAGAVATLERARASWQAQQSTLNAEAEKRAEERLAKAQERSHRETKDALARAEAAWKAAEAARLTDAEIAWREKSASAQADLAGRCERAEKALSEARAKPLVKMSLDEVENRRLRQDLATLRVALAERDTALAQTRSPTGQEQETQQRGQEAALSNAMAAWKEAEAARMSAAEEQWRKQSAASLAAMTARCDRAEATLVETRAQLESVAKSAGDEVEHRLRGELASLRTSVAERDVALAQARLSTEQSLQHVRQESEAALEHAQTRWKDDEAARFAVAEAQWRAQSTGKLAEISARCERAEAALSEAAAESARDDSEERRLRDELASFHAVLADRDMALAQTRMTAERALHRAQQESETALASARANWKTEEAARLAAAEAEWRKQSASALAEATARFKEAETVLAQIRVRGSGLDKGEGETVSRMRNEIGMLQAALAERDNDLLRARPMPELREESSSRIAIRENHDWENAEPREEPSKVPLRLIRDIVLVAALAASAIIFWPRLESYIPAGWLPNSAESEPVADSQAQAPAPAATPAPEQQMATVLRSANVRANPAKTAAVISTLQHGVQVAVIDTRNNWTLVRIDAKNSNAKPQQGWVYSSFLKSATDSEKPSPPTKR